MFYKYLLYKYMNLFLPGLGIKILMYFFTWHVYFHLSCLFSILLFLISSLILSIFPYHIYLPISYTSSHILSIFPYHIDIPLSCLSYLMIYIFPYLLYLPSFTYNTLIRSVCVCSGFLKQSKVPAS